MKYTYAYRTRDGKRLEASIDAPSRDVAFERLRAQGIRPIKVVAADGSKENGEVRGVSRRMVLALVALVAALVGLVAYMGGTWSRPVSGPAFTAEQTRRQVIGDAAIVDKGIATGWSDVFAEEGERFFASFAIPGVKAGQRNTTVEELEAALARSVSPSPDDGMESRQIKSMVEGMKAEARAYIAAGGSIVEYGKRLTERQDAEIAIYERTKADIEHAREKMDKDAFLAFWEERNDQLRNLGIKLVPLD